MNKSIKKYISLILILVSNFVFLPVQAMKTAKTQISIPSYQELITPQNQRMSRPSSLPTMPRQPAPTQNNPVFERHYGIQRNRLIKECLRDIANAIKSLFQKQSDINIPITA